MRNYAKKQNTMKHTLQLSIFGITLCATISPSLANAQALRQTKGDFYDAFRQLDPEELPTPNEFRSASGAPGYKYWQQEVDYKIKASLDEKSKSISGTEKIVYKNNSPDTLNYLWLLLDQNYKRNSISELTRTFPDGDKISFGEVKRMMKMKEWEGGFDIKSVRGPDGQNLEFSITDTLLRVELPKPLKSGEEYSFSIDWSLPLVDNKLIGGRSGYECFTKEGEDGNCIFEAAQWFPRLAVYSDYEGWHNKAFIGSGEFTLEFGDYDVEINVPSDFVIASTGELQNRDEILSAAQ